MFKKWLSKVNTGGTEILNTKYGKVATTKPSLIFANVEHFFERNIVLLTKFETRNRITIQTVFVSKKKNKREREKERSSLR